MDKIRAPYNFVPLDPEVVHFEALEDPHDRPFRDGICGTLEYELYAHTPIFVRGSNATNPEEPFRLPDGTFAIPGSSVRGMLRNVVEIATFSRFSRFNKHTLSIRDLTSAAAPIYGRQMSEIARSTRGNNTIMPVVSAGWLSLCVEPHELFEGNDAQLVAQIELCDFAKVEYAKLRELARARDVRRFEPGKRQSAQSKYAAWEGFDLAVRATVNRIRDGETSVERKIPLLSEYGEVAEFVKEGGLPGHLVFTGQPNEWRPRERNVRRGGHPKHHDFVFYRRKSDESARARSLEISRRDFRRFAQSHANRGQQGRLDENPNAELKFWLEVLKGDRKVNGHPERKVPVFFLPQRDDRSKVRALGLAMMFRLPYDHDIEHAIKHSQPRATSADTLDFASALFGRVESNNAEPDCQAKTFTLRGRVSVSVARAVGSVEPMAVVRAVLGVPRATYYPNYFEHGDVPTAKLAPPSRDQTTYRTLMDEKARIRGWKRYVPRKNAVATPALPPSSMAQGAKQDEHNADVASAFRPLPTNTRFRGRIRVHNLRPWELGALLWATDFGGAPESFHLLGLAKPLGYGRITLSISRHDLERNDHNDGTPVDLAECVKEFVAKMNAHFGGADRWETSPTIEQLRALAKVAARDEDVRHMEIKHQSVGNEFVEAKKANMALAPVVPVNASRWSDRKKTKHEARMLEGTRFAPANASADVSSAVAAAPRIDPTVGAQRAAERYREGLEPWDTVVNEFTAAAKRGADSAALAAAFELVKGGKGQEWKRWRAGAGGVERVPEGELVFDWVPAFAWVENRRDLVLKLEGAGPKDRPLSDKYQRGKMPVVDSEALSDALERATRAAPASVWAVIENKRVRRLRGR
jgi:CRISPR-associated protein (TIGR03986 family)